MSEFGDLWSDVAAPLLTECFAGTALCTPVGGTERTVTATIWQEEVTEEQTTRGAVRKHTRRLTVPRTAAAANGGPFLASPAIRDTWTILGLEYIAEAIEWQTESETGLRLSRSALHEESRENLRRRN